MNKLFTEGGVSTHKALPNADFMTLTDSQAKIVSDAGIDFTDDDDDMIIDKKTLEVAIIRKNPVKSIRTLSFRERYYEKYGTNDLNC